MVKNYYYLKLPDYIVLVLTLLISTAVGIYYRFKSSQNTTLDYFLANKQMVILPVILSIVATEHSAIAMAGNSAENYSYGTQLLMSDFGGIIGMVAASILLLPVFYGIDNPSIYDYLERRYGAISRRLASLVFLIGTILYISIVLYTPAIAVSAVTGISKWYSILIIGITCSIYSALGGMKAVLWADVFQCLLMFSTLFAVIIQGCIQLGGFQNMWKIADEGGRIQFFNFDPDPTIRYSFWSTFITGVIWGFRGFVVSQAQLQRLLTVNTIGKARTAFLIGGPLSATFTIVSGIAGITMYAVFRNCDPVKDPYDPVDTKDQLLPFFLVKYLSSYPGLAGFCLAGLFSGTLSSFSSFLNSCSATTVEDFLKPTISKIRNSERVAMIVAKLLVLLYGGLCIVLSSVVENLGGVLQTAIVIGSILSSPVDGIFFLGTFTVRGNQKGALFGWFCAVALTTWIEAGSIYFGGNQEPLPTSTSGCVVPNISLANLSTLYSSSSYNFTLATNATLLPTNVTTPAPEPQGYVFPLYRISYLWYSTLSILTTVIFGYLASLCTSSSSPVDPELLCPMFRQWLLSKKEESQEKEQIKMGPIKSENGKETNKEFLNGNSDVEEIKS